MKTKEWKIVEESPGSLILSRDNVNICFDTLWSDGNYWRLDLDGHFVARLLRYTNKITNYDDFADRIR